MLTLEEPVLLRRRNMAISLDSENYARQPLSSDHARAQVGPRMLPEAVAQSHDRIVHARAFKIAR